MKFPSSARDRKGPPMKRGTIDHPKTAMLADSLAVELYAAVGLLECLFHFTAQYARRGDIGRYSDKIIAQRCFWNGEPEALVAALVKCRWIESHPEHRLIVHDWHAHADNTVRTALKRNAEVFWNGEQPRRAKDEDGCDGVETPLQHGRNGVEPFQAKPSQSPAQPFEYPLPHGERPAGVSPTLQDVQGHAVPIGLAPAEAENFWNYYETRGWRTSNGQPIRSWQAALCRWKVTAQERASIARTAGGGNRKPIQADYTNPNDALLGQGGPTP